MLATEIQTSFRRMFIRGGKDDNLFSFVVGHISLLIFSVIASTLAVHLLLEFLSIPELAFVKDYANIEVMGFLALLIWVHELSHLALMRQHGAKVFGLLLPPIGGFMVTDRELDAQAMIPTGLAGPASGLVALPLLIVGVWQDSPHMVLMACVWAGVNWLNLLPLIPLDGGGIVKVILQAWVSHKTARNIMSAITITMLAGIALKIPDKRALVIPIVLTLMMTLMAKLAERAFSKFGLGNSETTCVPAKRLTRQQAPKAIGMYLFWLAILTSIMVTSIIVFANM